MQLIINANKEDKTEREIGKQSKFRKFQNTVISMKK